jgi:hypothetical protein
MSGYGILRDVIPRKLWLAAIFAVYLAYVAAHHVNGQVPMWAYLLIGSGVNLLAIAILRREHRQTLTRNATRLPGLPQWRGEQG